MTAAPQAPAGRPVRSKQIVDAEALARALEQLALKFRGFALPGGPGITAMRTLANLQEFGSQRITDLVAREGISQPGMTTLVTKLEEQGLVERHPDEQDGRVVNVVLTDEGRDLLRVRRAARAKAFVNHLELLTPEEQQTIADAVPALLRLTAPGVPERKEA